MAFLLTDENDQGDFTPNIGDDRSAKGIILDDCVTAETAAALTGYNIQHVRRLAFEGKLEAVRVGRAWLIRMESLHHYLRQARRMDDNRYGPRRRATLSEASLLSGGNS